MSNRTYSTLTTRTLIFHFHKITNECMMFVRFGSVQNLNAVERENVIRWEHRELFICLLVCFSAAAAVSPFC